MISTIELKIKNLALQLNRWRASLPIEKHWWADRGGRAEGGLCGWGQLVLRASEVRRSLAQRELTSSRLWEEKGLTKSLRAEGG